MYNSNKQTCSTFGTVNGLNFTCEKYNKNLIKSLDSLSMNRIADTGDQITLLTCLRAPNILEAYSYKVILFIHTKRYKTSNQ